MPPSSEVLSRLGRLHPRRIDLSLERIQRLLDRLGNPERQLPRVVHVAGTNGKGSVVAFLRAILRTEGLRPHVLTSPHLVRFHERIVLADAEIDDPTLSAVLSECEAANAGAPITFFEITTAAALLAFARTPADVTLLETGLGGRLDATNVVARPAVSVLTPISIDHQGFLGATLAAIAAEKAGILKPGAPAVSVTQPLAARRIIEAAARSVGTAVRWEKSSWSVCSDVGGFIYRSEQRTCRLPRPGLAGEFQLGNAGLAAAAAECLLGPRLADAGLREGIRSARWPGRLQHLAGGRLASLLPAGWELWLDGGHNVAAAEALAGTICQWRDQPLYMIFAMLRDKDAAGYLRRLAPSLERLIAVPIPASSDGLTPDEVVAIARGAGLAAEAAAGPAAALERLARTGKGPARVLIAGSLYLAGAVLAADAGGAEAR